MLKMTGIELELISDIHMYLFVGKGIRAGISYIAKRYSKAYSKYMKSYDDTKPSEYIMYLHANNLVMVKYGWEMSQYLPYSKVKFVKSKRN